MKQFLKKLLGITDTVFEVQLSSATLTDSDITLLMVERLGDMDALGISSETEEKDIYTKIGNVDGILDILRDTMTKDIRRYFAVTDGSDGDRERAIIRGAFYRTAHWRAKIMDNQTNI